MYLANFWSLALSFRTLVAYPDMLTHEGFYSTGYQVSCSLIFPKILIQGWLRLVAVGYSSADFQMPRRFWLPGLAAFVLESRRNERGTPFIRWGLESDLNLSVCCTATPSMPHQRRDQRRDQPAAAARRRAGGARCDRTRRRWCTRRPASSFQRPPISAPRTTSSCGPARQSSG